eukprot:29600-Eustigmatos_ZCMA.PRE.1
MTHNRCDNSAIECFVIVERTSCHVISVLYAVMTLLLTVTMGATAARARARRRQATGQDSA